MVKDSQRQQIFWQMQSSLAGSHGSRVSWCLARLLTSFQQNATKIQYMCVFFLIRKLNSVLHRLRAYKGYKDVLRRSCCVTYISCIAIHKSVAPMTVLPTFHRCRQMTCCRQGWHPGWKPSTACQRTMQAPPFPQPQGSCLQRCSCSFAPCSPTLCASRNCR